MGVGQRAVVRVWGTRGGIRGTTEGSEAPQRSEGHASEQKLDGREHEVQLSDGIMYELRGTVHLDVDSV